MKASIEKIEPRQRAQYSVPDPRIPVISDSDVTEVGDQIVPVLVRATSILRELHKNLGDYAPAWYSESLHLRAEAALQELDGLIGLRTSLRTDVDAL